MSLTSIVMSVEDGEMPDFTTVDPRFNVNVPLMLAILVSLCVILFNVYVAGNLKELGGGVSVKVDMVGAT